MSGVGSRASNLTSEALAARVQAALHAPGTVGIGAGDDGRGDVGGEEGGEAGGVRVVTIFYGDGVGMRNRIRNPKPETRNPKPETRKPKPETRNPEH